MCYIDKNSCNIIRKKNKINIFISFFFKKLTLNQIFWIKNEIFMKIKFF